MCHRIFRPPRPEFSIAHAITMADTAVRCWRGGRWRVRERPAVVLASELGVPALQRLMRAGLRRSTDAVVLRPRPDARQRRVRLDELVAAYSTLARGGEWIEPSWALQTHAAGTRSGDREHRQLVLPLTAYWITDVLSDDSAREHIFGRGGSLEFPFPVAEDGELLQAYHDNWTIGYTRDVTVGVWVGNFDRTPLKSSTGSPGLRRSSMRSCSPRPSDSTARQGSTLAPSSPCRTASPSAKCAPPACRRTLVPGAPARTVATGQRSALQLASLERRRPARHLAAGAPPVGEAERLDDRDGASSDERFDPSRRRAAATDRSTSARDREPSSRRDLPDRSDAQA